MPAPVVHINGHPGSGKLTIARALQDKMPGARLLDNHALLDPALALFERGTDQLIALRAEVRRAVFDAARQLDPNLPLILTDALDDSDYAERLFYDYIATLCAETSRSLHRFILDIDEEENIRRLSGTDRALRRKLTDPHILREGRQKIRILDAGHPSVTHIDVTNLTAQAAATAILATIQDTSDG